MQAMVVTSPASVIPSSNIAWVDSSVVCLLYKLSSVDKNSVCFTFFHFKSFLYVTFPEHVLYSIQSYLLENLALVKWMIYNTSCLLLLSYWRAEQGISGGRSFLPFAFPTNYVRVLTSTQHSNCFLDREQSNKSMI